MLSVEMLQAAQCTDVTWLIRYFVFPSTIAVGLQGSKSETDPVVPAKSLYRCTVAKVLYLLSEGVQLSASR
jgi:hypothetical protein